MELVSRFHLLDEDSIDGLEVAAQKLIDRGVDANPPYATCVILDDLQEITRGGKPPWVQNLFVSGCHQNVTTWDLKQTCFGNRTARLQCTVFVLGHISSKDECARLFQQICFNKTTGNYSNLLIKELQTEKV